MRARWRWALLPLALAMGGLLLSSLAALREAREAAGAVRAALQEAAGVRPLEVDPAAWAALGDRLRAAGGQAGRARLWSAPLRGLARLPGIPASLRARVKAVEVSPEVLGAGGRAVRALAEAARLLEEGDRPAAAARLEAAREDFVRLREGLARLLGDPDLALLTGEEASGALPALWLLAALGAEAPGSLADLLQAALLADALARPEGDPLSLLARPAETAGRLRALERALEGVVEGLGRLDPEAPAPAGLSPEALRRQAEGAWRAARGFRALAEVALAALNEGAFSPSFGRRARGLLQEAIRSLDRAAEALRAGGPAPGLPLPPRAAERVEEARDLARFAWWFLGYAGPRRYLLVAQNQQEIRATGGFIGLVAEVTLEEGVMGPLRVLDSTQVDPDPLATDPPAPHGLYWYLWMDRMLFRDSNWNPDFPTAARTVAALYRAAQGRAVDGVVAGTKALMVRLVGAVGGVRIPGHPGPVTEEVAADLVDGRLPYPCRPDHASRRPKRCAQEDLFRALLDRLRRPREEGPEPVLRVVREALAAKHLLVQVFQPEAALVLWRWGWNGALTRTDGDYLMVVESSLPGHAAPRVERWLEYRVRLRVDAPSEAVLRLRYRHRGPPQEEVCRQAAATPMGCYWNYLRLYLSRWARDVQAPPVPLHEGSEKLAWGYRDADSLTVRISQEPGTLGLVEVGAYLTVEPGTLLTFPLSFRLSPEALLPVAPGVWEYRLLLQKQPGLDDLRVDLEVALPKGATPVDVRPAPDRWDGGRALYRLTLDRDREVAVRFRLPPTEG